MKQISKSEIRCGNTVFRVIRKYGRLSNISKSQLNVAVKKLEAGEAGRVGEIGHLQNVGAYNTNQGILFAIVKQSQNLFDLYIY